MSWKKYFKLEQTEPAYPKRILSPEEKVFYTKQLLDDISDDNKSRNIRKHNKMKAEIYSKPNCPYCVKAKYLLEKYQYEIDEISAVDHRDVLIERVEKATGSTPKTVPQIWIDGRYIGGHDQLVEWLAKKG